MNNISEAMELDELKEIEIKSEVTYKCDFCEYTDISLHNLNKHMIVTHVPCNQCEYNDSFENLTKHIKNHIKEKHGVQCSYCEYNDKSIGDIRKHIKEKHAKPDKTIICKQCKYKTFSVSEMTKHTTLTHSRFKCSQCQLTTNTRLHLTKHMKSHHQGINKT